MNFFVVGESDRDRLASLCMNVPFQMAGMMMNLYQLINKQQQEERDAAVNFNIKFSQTSWKCWKRHWSTVSIHVLHICRKMCLLVGVVKDAVHDPSLQACRTVSVWSQGYSMC